MKATIVIICPNCGKHIEEFEERKEGTGTWWMCPNKKCRTVMGYDNHKELMPGFKDYQIRQYI